MILFSRFMTFSSRFMNYLVLLQLSFNFYVPIFHFFVIHHYKILLSSLHIFVHHCTFCASLHVRTSPGLRLKHEIYTGSLSLKRLKTADIVAQANYDRDYMTVTESLTNTWSIININVLIMRQTVSTLMRQQHIVILHLQVHHTAHATFVAV